MKSIIRTGLLAVALLSFGCSEKDPAGPDDRPGMKDGIPMPQLYADFDPMTDEEGLPGGKLEWNSTDRIKAFVVPSDTPQPQDWSVYEHRFTTDQKNCGKNLFSRNGEYGLDPEMSYDWYVMTPLSDWVLDPIGDSLSSTHFPFDGQVLNVDSPEAHLSDFDVMTGVCKNLNAEDRPELSLEHKCTLVRFLLVNRGKQPVTLNGLEVTAPSQVSISGIYSIDFSTGMELYPRVQKNHAVLDFSADKVLEPGETQVAYLVMPPFQLKAGMTLLVETLTENGVLENRIIAEEDMDFKAGSMRTFSLNLDSPELTVMVGNVPIRMMHVTGGTFMMGSPADQEDADNDEKPAHSVTLSDYYIGIYEVTQELWETVMGSNPSEHQGNPSYPVDNVSWDDINVEFLPRLNQMTGRNFSLPTEAQWEFAARGGIRSKGYRYSGSDDVNDVCWFEENSNGRPQPVGTKLPNELGLYDMSGNVWEWCLDWYASYTEQPQIDPSGPEQGGARILRGASYNYAAWNCRCTFRSINYPDYENPFYGFRLVLNQ